MTRKSLAFRALQHRNFRLFLGGLAVSLIGTWIQSVAQSWLLYRLTHSEFLQGISNFCSHMPVLLLSPVAGLAADRFPRHKIVLLTQTLFLLHACLLAHLTLTDQVTVTQVLVLASLLGCANAFDIPARQSLMILLTSKEDLLGAISLNSVAFNLARTLGPSVGGVLVAAVGEGVCFAINAVSFFAVLWSLLALKMPAVAARDSEEQTGLGILMASFGCGATVGVARLASRKSDEGLREVAGYGALLYGAALMGYAVAPEFWLVVAASFVAGFAFFRQNASNNALIQSVIEERYRGRVMSFYTMMAVGMLPVGSFVAGWAAERWGPRPVLAASALIALAAAGVFLRYTQPMEGGECPA